MGNDTPTIKKAWNRWTDETATAYNRFTVYLELGPDRSLRKTREKLGKNSGYQRQLETWSSKYNWVMRAEAYEEETAIKALLDKKRIANIVMGDLLKEARKAVRTIVEVMDMPNHTFGLGVKSNARYRLKAAEMVLNRIGVIEETEKTTEKTKPMSIYQEICQHLYGDDESKNSYEDQF